MHGVVFALLYAHPGGPPDDVARALLIPRCSARRGRRSVHPFIDIPSQFLRRAAALHPARFSRWADVLTFLRLSSRRAQNFASRLAKQNNAQP
ncbi:hypothetical protein EOW77_0028955 [Bradyrhizobium yuanmingense]|nr:hypothetical protein EOW77_0028955 [Bradyrhizobium yuanmingense]